MPEEVERTIDLISDQLGLIIKSLMAMEERVSRSEDKISKLNIMIYKRLEERRGLKGKIMNLE